MLEIIRDVSLRIPSKMHVMFLDWISLKVGTALIDPKESRMAWALKYLGCDNILSGVKVTKFHIPVFSKALNFKVLFSWRYRRSPETRFPTIETEHSDISACWLLCWHFVDCDPPQYALLIPIIRLYIFSMHYGWVGLVGPNVSHNSATDHLLASWGYFCTISSQLNRTINVNGTMILFDWGFTVMWTF